MEASVTPSKNQPAQNLCYSALSAARALQRATPIDGVRSGNVSISRASDSYTIVLTLPIEYKDTSSGEQISLIEYAAG